MSQQHSRASTVTVFASPTSWIESDAVAQCHQVAALDGMMHVAAMPDLHPGKGAPIGAAMTSAVLYPFLVGSDIGCGIAVFPVKLRRAVPEKLAARFPDLDRALDPERDAGDPAWDVVKDEIPAGYVEGLGTVGRGNHFVELARIGTVFEPGHAGRLGLDADDLVLIVHSGSRGLGERILRAHTEVHGAGPAPDPDAYLAVHDEAVRWGRSTGGCWPRGWRTRWGSSRPSRSSTSATTWWRSATGSTCTARGRAG
ncbi:RtcB family protein [Nonomuraea thailandensis]